MILYFVALGIGGIVITGLFAFNAARSALMERSYNQLTSIRLTRKAAIERFFQDRLKETAFLAENGGGLEQLATSDYYSGVLEKDAARELAENAVNAFIADYRYDNGAGRELVSVCRIRGSEEVLALVIRQEFIDSIMLEVSPRHGLGYSGETYLVGPDYLMQTSSRFIVGSVMKTRVETIPAKAAIKGEAGLMLAEDYRGIKVLSSYSSIKVPGLQWAILAEIDYKEATASINTIRNNIIVISLLTALALFILTYTISKRITRPLESNRVKSAIDGQEQERQRLSRELHDGIGQGIIAVRLRLAALETEVPEQIRERLRMVIDMNDSLIDEVRAASNALMPPALAEFGLMSAVRSIGHIISDTYGIDTIVKGECPRGLFGRKPTLYIFRIIQEAMNNAAKHSGANRLLVTITIANEWFQAMVTDNGKGFDVETTWHGHGLVNMRERVSLLKGRMTVDSSPEGTTVKIEIPVNKLQYDKIISG